MIKRTFIAPCLTLIIVGLAVGAMLQGRHAHENVASTSQPKSSSQPPTQAARIWQRYTSTRLGFSIDYPSDTFAPFDGIAVGEADAVTFEDKDWSPEKLSQRVGSSIWVSVTESSSSDLNQGINPNSPYDTTTLASLPAAEQKEGNCPSECDTTFVLAYKRKIYALHITNGNVPAPDHLSANDIEHIRQSFTLR